MESAVRQPPLPALSKPSGASCEGRLPRLCASCSWQAPLGRRCHCKWRWDAAARRQLRHSHQRAHRWLLLRGLADVAHGSDTARRRCDCRFPRTHRARLCCRHKAAARPHRPMNGQAGGATSAPRERPAPPGWPVPHQHQTGYLAAAAAPQGAVALPPGDGGLAWHGTAFVGKAMKALQVECRFGAQRLFDRPARISRRSLWRFPWGVWSRSCASPPSAAARASWL